MVTSAAEPAAANSPRPARSNQPGMPRRDDGLRRDRRRRHPFRAGNYDAVIAAAKSQARSVPTTQHEGAENVHRRSWIHGDPGCLLWERSRSGERGGVNERRWTMRAPSSGRKNRFVVGGNFVLVDQRRGSTVPIAAVRGFALRHHPGRPHWVAGEECPTRRRLLLRVGPKFHRRGDRQPHRLRPLQLHEHRAAAMATTAASRKSSKAGVRSGCRYRRQRSAR